MNDSTFDVETNMCPFKLQWAVGINVDVDVVNLTSRNRTLIAYACSHVVILYDYVSKDMTSLQGHKNAVRSLSASRDGKWLLSADFDEDSVCIVWNTETRVPICSLFNPHGTSSLTAARLSPSGKYFVTVGNESSQNVKLWLWTRGKNDSDATTELKETIRDRVKKISFCDDNKDEFILSLNQNVIFVSWKNGEHLGTQRLNIPPKKRRLMGSLNNSCYISKSQQIMSVTSNGVTTPLTRNIIEVSAFDFVETHIYGKALQTIKHVFCIGRKMVIGDEITPQSFSHKQSIDLNETKSKTPLILSDENPLREIIVIGGHSGKIYFYDELLRLLYWYEDCGLDSVVSISFDRECSLKKPNVSPRKSTISDSKMIANREFTDSTDNEDISESSRQTNAGNSEICGNDFQQTNLRDHRKHETESMEKNQTSTTKICREESWMKRPKNLQSSTITIDIDSSVSSGKSNTSGKLLAPTDCTVQQNSIAIPIFTISSHSGMIARVDITNLKCHIIMHSLEGLITAIAIRPQSDYVVTGDSLGTLCLYKYTTRSRMLTKSTPKIPNLKKLLNFEAGKLDTTYVTRPQIHESLVGVSALRYSPPKDGILICGSKNGIIWILHPDTLDPIDPNPYKHSSSSIIDIIFTDTGEYFAYSDDAFTVGVFRKKSEAKTSEENAWNFLGKYHSHCSPIREILFLKPAVGKISPRLLSIGEDRNLVEYDLENSGPYPEPGLKILHTDRIERQCLPLCMSAYPEFGVETFLITANSEWKFRLINDYTKTIRSTIIGPTLSDPIQRMHIPNTMRMNRKHRGYMIFATSKDIGVLVLPFDGNPYKIVAMIGHPKKIKCMAVSDCGRYLYTLGENERGLFMWKINYRSVDTMECLSTKGLAPFYSLIDGGENGWLVNEMKDLFYYAQILQQGENTTSTRSVNGTVSIIQLPNLMRAVGFYPTNNEIETMMEEVSYKHYAETGQLVEDITFDDFVKLYVNHRPAVGVGKNQIKDAFNAFSTSDDLENPSLTAKQFLQVLYGHGKNLPSENISKENLYGEPLSTEEAYTYLHRLVPQDEDSMSYAGSRDDKDAQTEPTFDFLPTNISYKSFIDDILGVMLPISSKHDVSNTEWTQVKNGNK